jgi:hypothetical protein
VNPHSACLSTFTIAFSKLLLSLNGLCTRNLRSSYKLFAMKLVVTCFSGRDSLLHHSWEHDSAPLVPSLLTLTFPRNQTPTVINALSHSCRPCINLLNTGDASQLRDVHVLRPDQLEVQMIFVCHEFLRHNVMLDESRRIIFIPKLCEVYRNDFADLVGAPNVCLQHYLAVCP